MAKDIPIYTKSMLSLLNDLTRCYITILNFQQPHINEKSRLAALHLYVFTLEIVRFEKSSFTLVFKQACLNCPSNSHHYSQNGGLCPHIVSFATNKI